MAEQSKQRRKWTTAPIVFVPRVIIHCPGCGVSDYIVVKSLPDESDQSKTRLCVCRLCSLAFKVVAEFQ